MEFDIQKYRRMIGKKLLDQVDKQVAVDRKKVKIRILQSNHMLKKWSHNIILIPILILILILILMQVKKLKP
jgi:hypothetical protein